MLIHPHSQNRFTRILLVFLGVAGLAIAQDAKKGVPVKGEVKPGADAPPDKNPAAPAPKPCPEFAVTFGSRTDDGAQAVLVEAPGTEKCPALDELATRTRPRTWQATVKEPALRQAVKSYTVGDGLMVQLDVVVAADGKKSLSLGAVSIRKAESAARDERGRVMACAAAVLFSLAMLFSWGKPRLLLLIGIDNRYSNSKVQATLWFAALIIAYLSYLYLRWTSTGILGNIAIPQNLLLLSGLSGITFVGAKLATERKHAEATAAGLAGKSVANEANFLDNVAQNDDGKFDLADFQMIVITGIAFVTYMVMVFHGLGDLDFRRNISLPDVDSTILSAFGLGHGAYLVKKTAGGINS